MKIAILNGTTYRRFLDDTYVVGSQLTDSQRSNLFCSFEWSSTSFGHQFWRDFYEHRAVTARFLSAVEDLRNGISIGPVLGPPITLEIT